MRRAPLFRVQALHLVVLLSAIASGVPSHDHERQAVGPIVVDPGHHGHGTLLVELDERQASELVAVALPAAVTFVVGSAEPTWSAPTLPAPRPVARGQPPPSDRPRAPPVSA